ncbi:MAG: hypothetical protein PHU63_04380, partial [Candidatus ainarchaeum sp.]|nr:hypothetical protein [Candidatus ainarchaeum sp.]
GIIAFPFIRAETEKANKDGTETAINAVLKRVRLPLLALGATIALLSENGIAIALGIQATFAGIYAYMVSTSNGMLEKTKEWVKNLFKKPVEVPALSAIPIKYNLHGEQALDFKSELPPNH